MPDGRSSTIFDTDKVRVTTWTFEEGGATGHHVHEPDYVIVPITGGTFEVIDSEGSHQMIQEPAVPYLGYAGTTHDVVNQSGRTAVFVEIELKS